MDSRTKHARITTADLDSAWAAVDAESAEPVVPDHARTMEELCTEWNTSYSIGLRKALKAWKAGKLNKARVSRHGRRIAVYWPK